MFRDAEVGEGPEMDMKGIMVVGLGEFGESCGRGLRKKEFQGEVCQDREFQEVRSEGLSEPIRKPRGPVWRGWPGCRHRSGSAGSPAPGGSVF